MSRSKIISAHIDYVTPQVEVIEIAIQSSLLVMSNEKVTEEDLFS